MPFTRDSFKGSFPALITPMKGGGVDELAFRRLVSWQIAQGSHGLVPCGTTGESPTLSHEEHMRVVEICMEEVGGRVPVIAGAGSNSTLEAIALTRHAKECGADAVLSVTGYYNKPSQEGMYRHYAAIAEAVDIPKIPNIVGVKDATANLARPLRERAVCGKDWVQLSGEDGTALAYMVQGGQGCISVTANVAPKLCAEFQNACRKGDYVAALALQARLMPLHDALFCEPSPAPVKYAVSQLGLCTDEVRMPLIAATDAARAKVRAAMEAAGVTKA
jgi:4-hydroxy-tetrahydrodipicolinate synthase